MVPTSWLGLLYSILCLVTQAQSHHSHTHQLSGRELSTITNKILSYREKIVQCLVRSRYAKGGPYILETLLNYILVENFLNRDPSNGVWLLMGNIVQIGKFSLLVSI